jgi:hypothetical protein
MPGCLAAFTSALRVMTDRPRVLQLQNLSCSLRSGERMAMRETTKISGGWGSAILEFTLLTYGCPEGGVAQRVGGVG